MKSALWGALLLTTWEVTGAEIAPIPFKQDPPIQIDGDLSDWRDVPNSYQLQHKAQIISQNQRASATWQGVDDFSGRIQLSWKPDTLYLAAQVRDDSISQNYGGKQLYKGDHVELFLDTTPLVPGSAKFGNRQFHIGISPGNFAQQPPEIFCYHPERHQLRGARCAAEKTAAGWNVEVAIPWQSLNLPAHLQSDLALGFEVWISDSDAADEALQKTVMTTGSTQWKFRQRTGMRHAALADAEGKIKGQPWQKMSPVAIAPQVNLSPKSQQKWTVKIPAIAPGLIPVLQFKARLCSPAVYSGYAATMKIKINHKPITSQQLINRAPQAENAQGRTVNFWNSYEGFVVPYSRDYASLDRFKIFRKPLNFHQFALNLSPQLHSGNNILEIEHSNVNVKRDLELQDLRIVFQAPPERRALRPAPTGKLPQITPQRVQKTPYQVTQSGNPVQLQLGTAQWQIASRFSTPDGRWNSSSSAYYRWQRRLEHRAEALIVHDQFTNLTAEPLPLMQRHEVRIPGEKPTFFINGLEAIPSGSKSSSFNSSSFGSSAGRGIGLYPLNKEFHIHAENYISGNDTIGLCDDMLVLPPHGSITQSFAVIPVATDNYWTFLNALRRLVGANFTIDCPLGEFTLYSQNVYDRFWQDGAPLKKRMLSRNNKLLLLNHHLGFRSDYASAEFAGRRAWYTECIKRLQQLSPGVQGAFYLHTQICTTPSAEQEFDEYRLRYKNGQKAYYTTPKTRLFLAIDGTPFARMNEEKIRYFMDNFQIDGFFWDEMASSATNYHYGKPWDRCSGDISPQTHKLQRLKSSVTLLQMPWQVRMVKMIQQRGKRIVANGRLYGELQQFKIPVLTESAQTSLCAREQVWTPIAYAKYAYVSCRTTAEYYQDMLDGLDYGCLFAGRRLTAPWTRDLQRPDLQAEEYTTLDTYMFPITPVELHQGYVIGQERIITKVSGLWGWQDNSKHEVHVFNDRGHEVPNFRAPQRQIDGHNYTELRLPEKWSAAIIRHQ